MMHRAEVNLRYLHYPPRTIPAIDVDERERTVRAELQAVDRIDHIRDRSLDEKTRAVPDKGVARTMRGVRERSAIDVRCHLR